VNALLCVLMLLPQSPDEAIVQLPDNVLVTGQMAVDVDGDGRDDLAIASRDTDTGRRYVQVHLRQADGPGFVSKAEHAPIEVDPDVVAFAFCDCHADAGRELVLLSPEVVLRVRRDAARQPIYELLTRHDLVWPAADPDGVLPLPDASLDFDGDGDDDLLLPQPDGWTCWLQQDGAFERSVTRALPRWRNRFFQAARGGALRADSRSFEVRIGSGGGPGGGNLVSTAARTPMCDVVDLDGDGRLDLATFRNDTLFGAMQAEDGALAAIERPLPLPENRLKLVDPAFDVQFVDVDGDGRADLLMTTSAQRDDDVEARVQWHLQRGDGTWPEQHDGRLRLQALAAPVELVDIDGDGARDLVCLSVRTSAMKRLTAAEATELDAQLTIFPGRDGGFARPASFNRAVPLFAGSSSLAQPFARVRRGSLLMRVQGALERRPLERDGDRLRMGDATARVTVTDEERVREFGDADDELLLVSEHEVRHVRFR